MPDSYNMRHLEVTLPRVTNTGAVSDYNSEFVRLLEDNGIQGWTQKFAQGVWRGQHEEVTVYTLYVPIAQANLTRAHLGLWARMAAPDQEAIQVVDRGEVTLFEY